MVSRKVIIPVIKIDPVCTAEPVTWLQISCLPIEAYLIISI